MGSTESFDESELVKRANALGFHHENGFIDLAYDGVILNQGLLHLEGYVDSTEPEYVFIDSEGYPLASDWVDKVTSSKNAQARVLVDETQVGLATRIASEFFDGLADAARNDAPKIVAKVGVYSSDAAHGQGYQAFSWADFQRKDIISQPEMYSDEKGIRAFSEYLRLNRDALPSTFSGSGEPYEMMPWITTGTRGAVDPSHTFDVVAHTFLNGSTGFSFYVASDINDMAHFVSMARAIGAISPFEDIVMDGEVAYDDFSSVQNTVLSAMKGVGGDYLVAVKPIDPAVAMSFSFNIATSASVLDLTTLALQSFGAGAITYTMSPDPGGSLASTILVLGDSGLDGNVNGRPDRWDIALGTLAVAPRFAYQLEGETGETLAEPSSVVSGEDHYTIVDESGLPLFDAVVRPSASFADQWELTVDVTGATNVREIWFPWTTEDRLLNGDGTDDYLYTTELMGQRYHLATDELAGAPRPNTDHSTFAPFTILADEISARIVASTDWPPTRPIASAAGSRQSIRFAWDADGYEAMAQSTAVAQRTYRVLIKEVNASASLEAWAVAVDEYRDWVIPQLELGPELIYPLNYPTPLANAHGWVGARLDEFGSAWHLHVIDRIAEGADVDIDWVQTWGQMSPTSGPCCMAHPIGSDPILDARFDLPSLVDTFAFDHVQGGGFFSYYARPPSDEAHVTGVAPDGITNDTYLKDWIAWTSSNWNAVGAYIGKFATGFRGPKLEVAAKLKAQEYSTGGSAPVVIEGADVFYPDVGFLVSGMIRGNQDCLTDLLGDPWVNPSLPWCNDTVGCDLTSNGWLSGQGLSFCEGLIPSDPVSTSCCRGGTDPKTSNVWCGTTNVGCTTFPRLGRYLLNDRVFFLGEGDAELGGSAESAWGTYAGGQNALERTAFLLGAKLDWRNRFPEPGGQYPVLARIKELWEQTGWWARKPLYLDRQGLGPFPTGIKATRFRGKEGEMLLAIDNPGQVVGAVLEVDEYSISLPSDSLSIVVGPAHEPADVARLAWMNRTAPLPKNRFISFSLGNIVDDTAIRVTLDSLPDFESFEGEFRWVGPEVACPGRYSLTCATLQCDPYYPPGNWTTDVLHVTGAEIVPDSTYTVELQDVTGARVLNALTIRTSRRGDLDDTGVTNVTDVVHAVEAVKKITGALGAPESLRHANVPDLGASADFNVNDVTETVNAVKLIGYPNFGPCSCPSVAVCPELDECERGAP